MITTLFANGKKNSLYKEYVVDKEDEITKVSKSNCCMGSTIFVIENQTLYMLNGKDEWVKV